VGDTVLTAPGSDDYKVQTTKDDRSQTADCTGYVALCTAGWLI